MSDSLYENLLKATDNTNSITCEKYATITRINGSLCDVRELDTNLEHTNVPILNGATLETGDKVIIGFLNNSIYDVICYGVLDRSIVAELPIVTQWESVPSDEKIPSEKLTKNSIDLKQDLLVSGTNIKTLNNESLLGEGNVSVDTSSHISYGQVDSTSTATVFTATVVGVSELKDGTAVMLRNGVITSASGWTLNVNGLGAKPVYSNMADATRETTTFNINYTILFIYDENRVDGGCWIYYRGYYSDANSVGYQLRTNSSKFKALDKGYRYRIWLEVSDGEFMPVNNSTSTNATANRSNYMNNREFMIYGRILYNGYNGTVDANAFLSTGTMWQQYTFALGYSFNNTNSALNLTVDAPLYMVAEPTSNGKARLHTPYYTQSLPSSEDNLIYIYLGHMYSATNIELSYEHRAYEYKNNSIREYRKTNIDDYDVTFTYDFGLGGIDDTITIHTELIERSD